jgi:translation elongation factor EF-G
MSSTAGDFRNLTPLVLMAALEQAGTAVCEPMHEFRLEIPSGLLGSVLPVLAQLQAVPRNSSLQGASYLVEGEIPAAQVHRLELQLPGLTSGEGVLESAFDHYRPVRGRSLAGRGRTTIRSTARSTCCTCCAGCDVDQAIRPTRCRIGRLGSEQRRHRAAEAEIPATQARL